jgi:hypothetical protein
MSYEEQLVRQEAEWRATCDKFIEDNQRLKDESKILNLNFIRGSS